MVQDIYVLFMKIILVIKFIFFQVEQLHRLTILKLLLIITLIFILFFYGGYVVFELSTKNSTEIDIYYDNRTMFRKGRIEGNLVLNSDLTLVDKNFHLDINLIQSQNLFWILQVLKNNNSWNIGYYSLNTIDLNGKV